MKRTTFFAGFTVLEFLIVLAIILILVSIALVGLVPAREKALDEKQITELKTVALGLEQFAQACGGYPAIMSASTACGQTGNNLGQFIPELDTYKFNDPDSVFRYVPLAITDESDVCVGFHLGTELRNPTIGTLSNGDKNFNSLGAGGWYTICDDATGAGFDGATANMFDIVRY